MALHVEENINFSEIKYNIAYLLKITFLIFFAKTVDAHWKYVLMIVHYFVSCVILSYSLLHLRLVVDLGGRAGGRSHPVKKIKMVPGSVFEDLWQKIWNPPAEKIVIWG